MALTKYFARYKIKLKNCLNQNEEILHKMYLRANFFNSPPVNKHSKKFLAKDDNVSRAKLIFSPKITHFHWNQFHIKIYKVPT